MPGYDASATTANQLQKQAAIDAVNIALNTGDCTAALAAISTLYGSANSDNGIRMAAASAYACSAGVNVFVLISDLLDFPEDLGGPGFWNFLVKEFPSTANPDDKKVTAGRNGMDALFAALKPGTILLPAYTVNSPGNNVGSVLTSDRIEDANTQLLFFGMSVMGALMNRNGLPSANYHKSVSLPWTTPAVTTGDGCSFSAALLNYYDSLQFIANDAPSSTQSIYNSINTFLTSSVNAACDAGCKANGCNLSCTTCPITLRNRASCTGVVTDPNSCAAAGITAFVNASWAGPP